ncbi:protein BYPASS1-LIKE-like [Typha latifolia]|uniref:protein BYPASS1-LIKE-like n=1 Tax=Typha latifolia TaxID=4733 RepID=UPI003C2EF1F1
MATADPQGGFLGLSLLSFRRNQVASSMESIQEDDNQLDVLHHFQTHVADRLLSLLPSSESGDLLVSLPFVSNLLDAFLSGEQRFRSLLLLLLNQNPTPLLSKPPLDRLLPDLLDRAVKSLDLCNHISASLLSLRHWQRHANIAAAALLRRDRPLSDAHLLRARRALARLLADRGGATPTLPPPSPARATGHVRALSWSVSKNWSTTRQLQPPSPARFTGDAPGGLALAVFTMNSVLAFVTWVLAISFHDGGSAAPAPPLPPRHLHWGAAMASLQERITEEWQRRERRDRNSLTPAAGLLAEVQGVERCGRVLLEFVGEAPEGGGPLLEQEIGSGDVAELAGELAEACRAMEDRLRPVERQVRAVFHSVVSCRSDVLRCLEHCSRSANNSTISTASASYPSFKRDC